MQKIGNLELINSRTLIIPPGDDAWIYVDAKGWEMKLHLVFNNDSKESNVTVTPDDGHARMEFNNWGSTLGTAIIEPLEVATHATGRKIYFIGASYSIGDELKNSILKIDLQFMMDV